MIKALKAGCLILCVTMSVIVVKTCLESNLIKEWDYLGSIPWMRATLWDFYFNIVLLAGWMFYKEKTWTARGLWLVGFVGLGSIATTFYVYRKLSELKPGDSWEKFWLRG